MSLMSPDEMSPQWDASNGIWKEAPFACMETEDPVSQVV
jgi:hypothetical protein